MGIVKTKNKQSFGDRVGQSHSENLYSIFGEPEIPALDFNNMSLQKVDCPCSLNQNYPNTYFGPFKPKALLGLYTLFSYLF